MKMGAMSSRGFTTSRLPSACFFRVGTGIPQSHPWEKNKDKWHPWVTRRFLSELRRDSWSERLSNTVLFLLTYISGCLVATWEKACWVGLVKRWHWSHDTTSLNSKSWLPWLNRWSDLILMSLSPSKLPWIVWFELSSFFTEDRAKLWKQ